LYKVSNRYDEYSQNKGNRPGAREERRARGKMCVCGCASWPVLKLVAIAREKGHLLDTKAKNELDTPRKVKCRVDNKFRFVRNSK